MKLDDESQHLEDENFESLDDKKGWSCSLAKPGSMTREND
jgi:hypothetical protein